MAKILIVEDDPLIGRMYQKIFSANHHKVELANNGEDGLIKISEFRPDLVLLDIMMPKMNGLEVLQKIKALPDVAHTPVVILTNLAGVSDAETALVKGAVKYLIKSDYNPKEVYEIVEGIIEGYTRDKVPETK